MMQAVRIVPAVGTVSPLMICLVDDSMIGLVDWLAAALLGLLPCLGVANAFSGAVHVDSEQ